MCFVANLRFSPVKSGLAIRLSTQHILRELVRYSVTERAGLPSYSNTKLLFLGIIDVTNPEAIDDEKELSGLETGSTVHQIRVKVSGDRDPGYGSTAKMLAQAAISLRRDVDKGEVGGGFWTPATVFNSKLIERLQDYAGMTFEVLDE